MKKLLMAVPGVAAVSSFASTTTAATVPDFNPSIDSESISFDIATPAAVAIGVVCAVAGVRVFIKLINRGAGK